MNDEPARPAAAVALLRGTPSSYDVLVARRNPNLEFLGGFDAFVGGATEDFDAAAPGASHPNESAAVREVFEETGVLLAQGAERLSAVARAELRRELLVDAGRWPSLLERAGLRIDPTSLVPLGRWVTPPYSPMRFAATYYGAFVPGDVGLDLSAELVASQWDTPTGLLARHARSELFITFPVLETLGVMAKTVGLGEASRILAARDPDHYPLAGGEMVAGVHLVPVRTYTLPPATHTNCYILGVDELVVVDPATPIEDEQARLIAYVEHLRGQGKRLRAIWLTHHHRDHIGAVNVLRSRFGVPVLAHRDTAARLVDDIAIDAYLADDERLPLDAGKPFASEWIALHTPGHAVGHLCFFDARRGLLLSGDNVLGIGTVVIAPPEGDMAQYLASLERMRELPTRFLFPAHGPPVSRARDKIQFYIDHRLARERSVLAALDSPKTPAELVATIYTDTDPRAYPLAELNVRAHLGKLVGEGRVRLEGERFGRSEPQLALAGQPS